MPGMDIEKLRMISLRLDDEEAERLAKVYEIALKKTMGYAPLSDVVRELIGFKPFHLISESDRETLRVHIPAAKDSLRGQRAG
jgi:hypothetical protein